MKPEDIARLFTQPEGAADSKPQPVPTGSAIASGLHELAALNARASAVIGDAHADWRGTTQQVPQRDRTGATTLPDGWMVAKLEGRILKGPEDLTVFDGMTGRTLATAPYDPPRYPGGNPTFEQMTQT